MYNYKLIESKTSDEYIDILTENKNLLSTLLSYINRFDFSADSDFTDLYRVVELICYVKINDIKTGFDSLIDGFLNVLYEQFLLMPKRLINLKVFKEPFLSKCFDSESQEMINSLLDKINLDYKKDVRLYLNKRKVSNVSLRNIYKCANRFSNGEEAYLLDDILYNFSKFSSEKKEFLINALAKKICKDFNIDFDSITINISGDGFISHDSSTNMITIGKKALNDLDYNSYSFVSELLKKIKSLAVTMIISDSIDDFYAVKNEIFKKYLGDKFLDVYTSEFGILDDNTSSIYGYVKTNEILRDVNIPQKKYISDVINQNNRNARALENNINKKSFFVDLNVLSRLIRANKELLYDYPVLNYLFDEKGHFRSDTFIVNNEKHMQDLIRLFYKTYKKYQDKELTEFEKTVATANGDVFSTFNNTSLIDKRIEEIKSEAYTKKYNIWG